MEAKELEQGFIIYKVMKYRKIYIKYNAYLEKAVFHSCENINRGYLLFSGEYQIYFIECSEKNQY